MLAEHIDGRCDAYTEQEIPAELTAGAHRDMYYTLKMTDA